MLFSSFCFSQSFTYTYDASGERTHRELVQLKSVQATSDTTAEFPVVSQLEEMQISIFPNPTKGALRIEITNLEEGSMGGLTIWNLGGQEVLHIASISSSMIADMSALPTGNYILQIVVGDKKKDWSVIKQ